MHIAVFADIEGSFGIWRMRQCRTGTPEWQYGRECLTEDVNSVIRGAFDAGAKRVTVKDTHATGFNCLPERLDPRARYLGGHFAGPTFFGDILDCDLILYVAIHAASGTPDAFFPHTHYGIFSEVWVNGNLACEMDIYGGYLGELGIPVGFVSGDEAAVRQAKKSLPWAKSVTVDKRKETYTSGEKSIEYLKRGRAELREVSARAVSELSEMKPLIVTGPLHFEVTFVNEEIARKRNSWNFPQDGATVSWDAENMIEGFDKFNKITFFSRSFYPFRRPLLFSMRKIFSIKNNKFAPKPNREGAAVYQEPYR